jgi:hypothetical protein
VGKPETEQQVLVVAGSRHQVTLQQHSTNPTLQQQKYQQSSVPVGTIKYILKIPKVPLNKFIKEYQVRYRNQSYESKIVPDKRKIEEISCSK